MSNLSRKLEANLEFRQRKQVFWRWWSGERRQRIRGPALLRTGNKQDGYKWFRFNKQGGKAQAL